MSGTLIIVEGPTDHQFVGGLLARQGWDYLRGLKRQARYRHIGGEEAMLVYVDPGGDGPALARAEEEFGLESPWDNLVLVLDDDSDGATSGPDRQAQFKGLVTRAGGQLLTTAGGQKDPRRAQLGQTRFSLAVWNCAGEALPGVPAKQTLERLVCQALATLGPEAAKAVHKFLDGQNLPRGRHKHHAMAYFALHMPDVGNHEFYRFVWGLGEFQLPGLADEDRQSLLANLIELTKACGAWQVLESLKRPQTP